MPNSNIVLDSSHEVFLTESEAQRFRLSSKTHVDVPISIGGETIHTLLAHPTPPTFDGPENFNGKRNHDEVRLLADYVAGAEYLVDDDGRQGGLSEDASYVLLGDMNASLAGDENRNAAETFFIENEDFNTRWLPTSPGGAVARSPYITAEFGLKVDYVLPSPDLLVHNSAVVWPVTQSNRRGLSEAVRTASDHRLVWATLSRLPHA